MSLQQTKQLTVEGFLAWEQQQLLRHEFDGRRTTAMTGGSLNHSAIATNVVRAQERRLKAPCRAYRGDVKVLAADSVRYPDAAPRSMERPISFPNLLWCSRYYHPARPRSIAL
jgi:Uma2 family endonuclease